MQVNGVLDWDDEWDWEEPDFTLLPPGDYDFEVTGFEEGEYGGSAKVPACKKAVVTMRITGSEGATTVIENFLLFKTLKWKMQEFLVSVGVIEQGGKVSPRLFSPDLIGREGRCKIYVDKYIGSDGKEHENNKIKKYFAYDKNRAKAKPSDVFDEFD